MFLSEGLGGFFYYFLTNKQYARHTAEKDVISKSRALADATD